ncbi:hypothetical protein D3C85_1171350 [compost metagenome]
MHKVQDGEVDLAIATPAGLLPQALRGEGMFAGRPAANLRALAVLPQDDRMVLAIDPRFEIRSYEELRTKRPPLRIAASHDDGTNFIGYVGRRMMEAHGIDEATLRSWGGEYVCDTRPDEALARMKSGTVDAVLQEAIMAPWWSDIIETGKAIPLSAEEDALARLSRELGLHAQTLPAGYWSRWSAEVRAPDFADFLVLVRDDMPDDVAYLLTWCLVETRDALERQYRHLPQRHSPLSYPLVPARMADTSIPLHDAARRYYREAGHLANVS